ncbi:MAG: hypothetical protein COZ06_14960, partial [Armatimonadetes bacterium CG_4_10_14_3_um_filter_66_18]
SLPLAAPVRFPCCARQVCLGASSMRESTSRPVLRAAGFPDIDRRLALVGDGVGELAWKPPGPP